MIAAGLPPILISPMSLCVNAGSGLKVSPRLFFAGMARTTIIVGVWAKTGAMAENSRAAPAAAAAAAARMRAGPKDFFEALVEWIGVSGVMAGPPVGLRFLADVHIETVSHAQELARSI